MTLILTLLALFARPDCPPVTLADVERTLALERELTEVSVPELPGRAPSALSASDRIPDRFVVGFEPGRLDRAMARITAQGAELVRVDTAGGFLVCTMPEAAGLSLARQALPDELRWFEPDFRVRICHLPNDPYFLTDQWDKWVMYADRAWDITRGSTDITIAICDNGVEYTHPDLAARFTPGDYGYDFVAGDNDPKPDNIMIPEAFHGTHVAGIAAATMDNGIGIAGWAGVRLLAVKVLNDSGSGSMSDLASGIRWAADRGANIINMSLGSDGYSNAVAEAARYAAERNVLLVAAAGNTGTPPVQYPARLPEVISVGATDSTGDLAEYSCFGAEQELAAPGSAIRSCWTGGAYGLSWGTSMSAPQVAGIAALVMSAAPGMSARRVRAVLAASAVDMDPPGRDARFGYGLANAYRAVTLAARMAEGPERVPPASGSGRTLTRIVAGPWQVPDWAGRVEVYDVSGRGGPVVEREISLPPGTWFVRLSGPDRNELVRLNAVP